ncbi:MAG: PKD domain-containing protein [Mameliella sp.]|nr:PKD domain-containing protein [Phaeodactylibacter sp.]
MKSLFLGLLLCLISIFNVAAQSSEGNTFWLAYMENLDLLFNDDPAFSVIIHSDSEASGEVELPVTGFSIPFTVPAGGTTEVELPPGVYYVQGSDVTGNFGLRITSDVPVRATGIHYRAYFSESTHLLPESELGVSYLPICYADDNGNDPSSFVILSTADGTEVEIVPSVLTLGFRPPGVPYTVTLDAGQIYQVQAVEDLTGTTIQSLTGEPIAVFSGAKQADIIDCGQPADSHPYDQVAPVDKWGTLFYHTPLQNQGAQVIRVLASENGTDVFVDCNQVATLDRGEYYTVYDQSYNSGRVISSTQPVAVAQFNTNGGCSPSGLGDPNMLWLWPAEYQTRSVRFKSLDRFNELIGGFQFSQHSVNIVADANEVADIELDGNPLTGNWLEYPGNESKVYRRISVSPGEHELNSPHPFQAYVYGIGFADAYTYFAGYSELVEEDYACIDIEVEGVFCVDSLLQWSFQTSLNVTDVNWDFGDGQTAQSESPEMSYGDEGAATVVLTLTTTTGTFTDTLDVSIQLCTGDPCPDDITLNIEVPQEACANTPVQLGFDFGSEAVSASWDLGAAGQANGLNPEVTFANAGTYLVTVTVQDALNCTYTATTVLNVLNCGGCGPELVDLDFEGFACVDSLLVFPLTEFLIADPPVEVTWTVDGQTFFDLGPLEYAFPAPGIYTVTFQAISLQGCSYIGEQEIQIQDCSNDPCIGQPSIEIIPPDNYCLQQPLTFTIQTAADLLTYAWNANNGVTGDQAAFTVTFEEAGVGTVSVEATDANGCVYSAVIEDDLVDCGDDPCEGLPELQLNVSFPLCLDSVLTFSVSGATLITYDWTFSNLTTSTVASPQNIFQEEGLFTASLTAEDANGCTRTGSLSFEIQICEEVDPCLEQPELLVEGDSVVCLGDEAVFTVSGPDGIVLYDWSLDVAGSSTDANPVATFDENGIYTAVLIAVDEEGCTFSDNFSFEVRFCEPDGGCAYAFPNAFSPNADGVNDTFELLRNCPVTSFELRVFNRWGGIVYESDNPDEGWDGRFNGKDAPIEVYFYQAFVETPNGEVVELNGDVTLVR